MIFSPEQICELLQPYFEAATPVESGTAGPELDLCEGLGVYLELLVRWNQRTNLTAITDPVEMVRRHFGESLFLARHLAAAGELLDYGSGAGFPGIPVKMYRRELSVTLAESQGKKVSFLREVGRALKIELEIWPRRVEELPVERRFEAVTLRAVDRMDRAIQSVARFEAAEIWVIGSESTRSLLLGLEGYVERYSVPVPGAAGTLVCCVSRGSD